MYPFTGSIYVYITSYHVLPGYLIFSVLFAFLGPQYSVIHKIVNNPPVLSSDNKPDYDTPPRYCYFATTCPYFHPSPALETASDRAGFLQLEVYDQQVCADQ